MKKTRAKRRTRPICEAYFGRKKINIQKRIYDRVKYLGQTKHILIFKIIIIKNNVT